jgi:GNAT superfamily N-acetyltransferase
VRIRQARVADARQIGLVHVRSWQGAYQGLVPQDYLDQLDPASRAAGWRRTLSRPDERAGVFVAESGEEIVGFASAGRSRDEDASAATGELYAIYMLPQRWGRGAGRALMSASVSHLSSADFKEATLWVLESNTRTRGFYAKGGWEPDGATKTDESRGFPLVEVRYRRALPG